MRVPVLRNQKAPEALPAVREQAGYDANQFGAQVGGQVGEAGKQLARVAALIDEKDTANVQEIFNQYRQEVSHRFENGEDGFFTREGKDAIGIYQKSGDFLNETMGRYQEQLSGKSREKFQRLASGVNTAYLGTADRYEAQGTKVWKNSAFDASQHGLMDDMIVTGGDKARVVPMMESYIDNIKIHYANQGTEVVAQKIKEGTSKFHVAMINGLLQKDPAKAQTWAQEFQDQIDPELHAKIFSTVDNAVFTGTSASISTEAYQQSGGDLGKIKAYAAAKAELLYPNQPDKKKKIISEAVTNWQSEEKVKKDVQEKSIGDFYLKVYKDEAFKDYKTGVSALNRLNLDGNSYKAGMAVLRSRFSINEEGRPQKSPPGNLLNARKYVATTPDLDVVTFASVWGNGELSDSDFVETATRIMNDPSKGQATEKILTSTFETFELPVEDYTEYDQFVRDRIKNFVREKNRQPNQMEVEYLAIEAGNKITARKINKPWWEPANATSEIELYKLGRNADKPSEEAELVDPQDGSAPHWIRIDPATGKKQIFKK